MPEDLELFGPFERQWRSDPWPSSVEWDAPSLFQLNQAINYELNESIRSQYSGSSNRLFEDAATRDTEQSNLEGQTMTSIIAEYVAPAIKDRLYSEARIWLGDRDLTHREKHTLTRSLNTFLASTRTDQVRFVGARVEVAENEDLPDENYRFTVADVTANWSGSAFEVDINDVMDGRAPRSAITAVKGLLPSWATLNGSRIIPKQNSFSGRFADARAAIAEDWGRLGVNTTLREAQNIALKIEKFQENRMAAYRRVLKDVLPAPEKAQDTFEVRAGRFGNFLSKRKLFPANASDILMLPIAQSGQNKVSSRTWGIEIEHIDTEGISAPRDWDARYDGSLDGVEKTDDSGYDVYTETREYVSPILRKVHSSRMKGLLEELEGREINETPGVHVHVGADDLNIMEQARLVRNYALIEPIIEPIYQRETRTYCRPHEEGDVFRAVLRSGRKGGSTDRARFSSELRSDRYVSLNLQAMERHGTVEFRAMGPVYNYEDLIRWARFCREFVNLAKIDIPQKKWESIKNWKGILDLIAEHGAESSFSNA